MKNWWIIFLIIGFSCGSGSDKNQKDRSDNGEIRISADEAFRPAIEEQALVYQGLHPGVRLKIDYKPESECWEDLYNDSVCMVIVSRQLQTAEAAYFYDSLKQYPQNHLLAFDAVALVVNRSAKDSVFSTDEVIRMLSDTSSMRYEPVFDGRKATGTVRFALDSILKGTKPALNRFRAASSSTEVIRYVEEHPDAVGFVGISWIGDPEDSAQISARKKVRIAWLPCQGCGDISYTLPVQEEIFYRRYPYTRSIFAVLKEQPAGTGTGFVNFMKSDQGQLLFRRLYLVPARRPFIIRETQLDLKRP